MPLTKSDKLIIVGAVVLALAVVAGLAAWRKPHLFTGGKPAPEMTTRDFSAPAPPVPAAPATPTPPPAPTSAVTPPPAASPPTAQAPPAATGVAALPAPDTAVPLAPAPAASPSPAAQTPAAGKEPVSPEIVSQHPLFAGDQTLDKMFSDMGQEAAAPKVDTGKRPAATAQTPPPVPDAPPKAPAPEALPATAESLDAPPQKPGLAAKKPVKDKPVAAGKPAPGPSKGAVVAVSAVDKPGEYVLTVTTTSPVGEVTRTYMDGPPGWSSTWPGAGPIPAPCPCPEKAP
ncbi:hypothetical protein [Desulfolutivibrio sulfodismutans]|nr:hypothetical protein [Desulfolutivibrio sulfodismutans]